MPTKSTSAKRSSSSKAAPKKTAAAKAKPRAKSGGAAKTKRKPNPALMRPVQPDSILAAIVGSKPLPRGQITKSVWVYIKKNGLQDAKKRTMINADDALRTVFGGKKQVTMFEMTKLVNNHIQK